MLQISDIEYLRWLV